MIDCFSHWNGLETKKNTATSQECENFGLNMETLNSLAQMRHLWWGWGWGRDRGWRKCYNSLNQKRRLGWGGGEVPMHHPRRQPDFDLCTSLSDSGLEAPREAPGFDFSCFIKKIMIQMLACVCHRARNVKEVLGFIQRLLGEPWWAARSQQGSVVKLPSTTIFGGLFDTPGTARALEVGSPQAAGKVANKIQIQGYDSEYLWNTWTPNK